MNVKTQGLFCLALLSALAISEAARAGSKQLSLGAGIDQGGLILGANFDVADSANENFGGYARVFSKDRERGEPSIFALGASFTGHAKVGIFDYYLSPGFGMLHHSIDQTELLFGPSLALGLRAELDKTISLGVENAKLFSWIGEYKGLIKDSFLVNISFNL